MFGEQAAGDYTFKCKVTDGNGSVESRPVIFTIRAGNPAATR